MAEDVRRQPCWNKDTASVMGQTYVTRHHHELTGDPAARILNASGPTLVGGSARLTRQEALQVMRESWDASQVIPKCLTFHPQKRGFLLDDHTRGMSFAVREINFPQNFARSTEGEDGLLSVSIRDGDSNQAGYKEIDFSC